MYIYPNESTMPEIIRTLNLLYQRFQDEYVSNSKQGQVHVVSNSHIICNGSKNAKIVTLSELYSIDDCSNSNTNSQNIKEIRVMANLLPKCARFYIIHYPESHDVFVIDWNSK